MSYEILDLKTIINNKITNMLENKVIQEKIEKTIEDVLLRTITDSISNYDIRNILEKKMKDDVSECVKDLDLTGYTNKIIQQIGQIIEKEQNKDLSDKILQEYNSLFVSKKDKITEQQIIDAYEEYIKETQDNYYDKTIYYDVKVEQRYYSEWVEIKLSLNEDFDDSYFSETYRITITNDINNKDFFYITSIYENGDFYKDLTKRLKSGVINSFEKLLINAFYNKTPIEEIHEHDGSRSLGDDY